MLATQFDYISSTLMIDENSNNEVIVVCVAPHHAPDEVYNMFFTIDHFREMYYDISSIIEENS